MKGISVWIWLIASFIIGILMFTISLQFINYITTTQQRELATQNLDDFAADVNGLCTNRAGNSVSKTIVLPEKITSVYSTNDIKIVPNTSRTNGNKLCMNFSSEFICDNLNCVLEMDSIRTTENLQSLLNQFLGKYGVNTFTLTIAKTDCGVAALNQGSQSNCKLNNTLT